MSYQNQQDGGGILALIVVIIVGVIAVSTCSRDNTPADSLPNSTVANDAADSLLVNDVASEQSSEPLPLNSSAVRRGSNQLVIVAKLQSNGASRIFSLNCYDAVNKTFDWQQLDRCGGFDALASRWVEEGANASLSTQVYFQSEGAAGRYLAAATGHGLAPEQADLRWEQIKAAARKAPGPPRPPVIADAGDAMDSMEDNLINEATAPSANSDDVAAEAEERED